MNINFQPYFTYVQSFNFRSTALLEISFDENKH